MYGQFRKFLSKTFLTTLSSVFALLTFSSALHAQEDEGPTEELVVTGFRGSLEAALDQKRDSVSAVDSIQAEDIADFPDLNLAESLQRIPGVSITRAAGAGNQVTVRGLGPTFTTTRINGMEALSTSGFTDALGGNNRSRGFDFSSFDTDVFKSLTVYKTSSAELEEGALGATIELQTARPFDYDGFTAAATVQLGYNDRSEESAPRFSALISNTFLNDTLGALLSVSSSNFKLADEGSSTVRWSTTESFGTANGVAAGATHEVNLAWHPRLPRFDSYKQETDRLGVSGALQYRPTDNTEINLDVLQSNADVTRDETFMQVALNNNTFVAATGINNYQIRDNAIVYGELTNATLLSESRHDELSVDFKQHVLSASHDFTDTLRLNAMVGTAESEFDNPVQRYVILQKNGSVTFDARGDEGADYAFGPQASDPAGWSVNGIRKREPYTKNTIDQAEIGVEFDLTDGLTLKGGIVDKTYEFETFQARMAAENNNGITGVIASTFLQQYDAGPLGSWAAPIHSEFDAAFGFYDDAGVFQTRTADLTTALGDIFAVKEETQSVYAQLDFNFELGLPIRGNVGFRDFTTEQNSSGLSAVGVSREADVEYDDILPALNVAVDLTDDLIARLGWAEVIVRPGMQNLRPVSTVTVAGSNLNVNGNNPGLGPTEATATDLGLEWYFAEESVLAVAFFQKDIDTFIQTIVQQIPYTETGLDVQLAVDACTASPLGYGANCNENMLWNVNAPGNSPGGKLDGYEVSYQQPFASLPGIWGNFGLILNFTHVEATIDYLGVVANQTAVIREDESLVNLSPDASNFTLYYEDEAFSARVSVAQRDDYLTNVPGRNSTFVEFTEGTSNVDFSASYQLSDSFKLTFEGLNLTDEAENQRLNVRQPSATAPNDAPEAPANVVSYYHQTGKQYFLGLRYNLQ